MINAGYIISALESVIEHVKLHTKKQQINDDLVKKIRNELEQKEQDICDNVADMENYLQDVENSCRDIEQAGEDIKSNISNIATDIEDLIEKENDNDTNS